MPESSSILKFHNGQYQFKVLFLMYADFESILQPISGWSDNPHNPIQSENESARAIWILCLQ